MSQRLLTVTFTEAEARELIAVATNGYGDGEYYQNPDGTDSGRGTGKAGHDAFGRATAKLNAALEPSPRCPRCLTLGGCLCVSKKKGTA
jgi:hypothetical protein